MDADRFDVLLQSIARMRSRRGVLRGLSGLGLAGVLYRADGVAKKKQKKKRKKQHTAPPPLSTSPPPGPPASPSAICPPVCPICQGCNAATGQCEGHLGQQSLPAPGCTAPKVCCGGACCDPIHACSAAGTCQTCAEACPDNDCGLCVHLADGSTQCAFELGHRCDLPESCSTDSDCPFAASPRCMTGYTDKATNVMAQICGRPVGSGWCVSIHASHGCGA
jgi:hypothetical protein